jgi:hypothetical protein
VKKYLITAAILLFAFVLRSGAYKQFGLGPSSLPYVPDKENADGTIDYALVGRLSCVPDCAHESYSTWVLRLPKELKISRPGAGGMSGSGPAVSFTTRPNPNSAIYFDIKWPSFEDGSSLTTKRDSAEYRKVILIALDEQREKTLRQDFEKTATNPMCSRISTNVANLFKLIDPTKDKKCWQGICPLGAHYTLVDGIITVAEVDCREAEKYRGCSFLSYFGDHRIHGYFSLELLAEFPAIHGKLVEFLKTATVSDDVQKL